MISQQDLAKVSGLVGQALKDKKGRFLKSPSSRQQLAILTIISAFSPLRAPMQACLEVFRNIT